MYLCGRVLQVTLESSLVEQQLSMEDFQQFQPQVTVGSPVSGEFLTSDGSRVSGEYLSAGEALHPLGEAVAACNTPDLCQAQYVAAVPGQTVATHGHAVEVDTATESNRDTALTLACAGGHDELVRLLLSRGANIG